VCAQSQPTTSTRADRLEHLARAKAISHSREGIDYFVYPRTFSPRPPAFLVGRIQWDNWVLLWAISHRALWTVECSDAVHAVHLDHGLAYGSHDRPGTDINKNLALNLPHPWVREFKIFYPGTIWLGRLDETDYVLTANTSLISLFAQPIFLAFGERRLPAYFSPGAPPARTACPHCVLARNWQSRAVVLFSHFDLVFDRRTIVLVFVPDVDAAIRRAQAWYCQATSRGVHNFLFVAADQDTAASLLATGLPVLPPDHEKPASANGNLNFLSVVYDVLFLGYNVVLCGLQHTPAASLQSVFTTDTDVQVLSGLWFFFLVFFMLHLLGFDWCRAAGFFVCAFARKNDGPVGCSAYQHKHAKGVCRLASPSATSCTSKLAHAIILESAGPRCCRRCVNQRQAP
jgi:hypothetical protein